MDSAHRSTRKFPAYTTAQLRAFLQAQIDSGVSKANYQALADEIAARESGESKHFVTPQVSWK